jgi:maltose phosphorylase
VSELPKTADRQYEIHPWKVIERGFRPQQSKVSESIFSLSNEYMGVRGYFDEGYCGDSLVGSYINGVYEEIHHAASHYKGISNRLTFMVNTLDWLYTRIFIDGEQLVPGKSRLTDFVRELDMRNGLLTRRFVWETAEGKRIEIEFLRFLSMIDPRIGYQQVKLKPLNFSGRAAITSALDFSLVHHSQPGRHWDCLRKGQDRDTVYILSRTKNSKICVCSGFRLDSSSTIEPEYLEDEALAGVRFELDLTEGQAASFDKKVANLWKPLKDDAAEDRTAIDGFLSSAVGTFLESLRKSFADALEEQTAYWSGVWEKSDIVIRGDDENQQGIRYCIFQLHQTFHGRYPGLNIGAKGLTGEAYNGHAFWDSETYCLPFYLFSNTQAARNLLLFRYRGLTNAKARARELDCSGACYPIATLDGTESCNLWQHASLQLQPSTGVAYGIWHYTRVTGDTDFLYNQGAEMLVEISRFLRDRSQRGQKSGKVGYYCVMGPDEFQMMVNHNCYTNFMAKKTFMFTVKVLEQMKSGRPTDYARLSESTGLSEREMTEWASLARDMYIPYDEETGLYEQHDGFFDLPHIDVKSIPEDEFPLYNSWSYDRIFRNDMIKQPDVLMFMFLYNQEFSRACKKANYEYYEPRCIHESSLSPSVHSILAAELGKAQEAYDFFRFATRLDLDNYNRNTDEGLHLTSIAAAWMNVVYGFGGLRSDGETLSFEPSIPKGWDEFSFKIVYRGSVLEIRVDRDYATYRVLEGGPQVINAGGRVCEISDKAVRVPIAPSP